VSAVDGFVSVHAVRPNKRAAARRRADFIGYDLTSGGARAA
jgi:hypothetical protein